MAAATPIRLRLANFKLRRKLRKFERQPSFSNLDECKRVMLISHHADDAEGRELLRFASFFEQKGMAVEKWLYTGKEKDPSKLQGLDFKTFGNKDLNYLFIPKMEEMLEAGDKEFDLFIDLSLSDEFPLKYMLANSRAGLRVGASLNYKKEFADLTIDIQENKSLSFLITQIKHYLSIIHNKKENVEYV